MKVKVAENILSANDRVAEENSRLLKESGVYVINMMSSPGAGKTTLLEKTLAALKDKYKIGVIEGDVATTADAERIEKLGVPVVQINTGSACHLDGSMVRGALEEFDLGSLDLLIVENVGNLVCPAEFNLGEDHKVMLLSVAEGDDKPLKYPLMFRESAALVINKIDLIPYTNFDMDKARRDSLSINPRLDVFPLSCRTGEGLDGWLGWLESGINAR
ncbi:MAG: hydrogenase nickel incorporation protein HypB [Nitrospirae bacterium]|nr:hydrogenase nickel incorporation protein HypB [Nitrospirota bacterium]